VRKRIAMAALGVVALASPAVAQGKLGETVRADLNDNAWKGYEERYLDVQDRYAEEFSVREAGRNIVLDGYHEKDGDVRHARKAEVLDSIETMETGLNPPEAESTSASTETDVATSDVAATGGAASSSATAQCESGGDYGAVNPAGYYGAYQFDQGTWDAYAPEGYQGVNPAEAPPAAQDAAAAAVPYDAWPSCP
jgi:hypothetical protein